MAAGEVGFPGTGAGNLTPVVSVTQWQQMMGAIIADGIYDDGTFTNPGLVIGDSTGAWVKVNAYKASIAGFPYLNPAQLVVPITPNSAALDRVDLIALNLDLTAQTVTTVAVAGIPNASPVARTPVRGVNNVWQFPLGHVSVGHGALTVGNPTQTIAADKVTDTRQFAPNLGTLPRGTLAQTTSGSPSSTFTTTEVQILTVTFTAETGRRYEVLVNGRAQTDTGGHTVDWRLRLDTLGGTQLNGTSMYLAVAGGPGATSRTWAAPITATLTPGSHTIIWTGLRTAGVGTGSVTIPVGGMGSLAVRDVGPLP